MKDGIGHMPYEEVPEEYNQIALDFPLRDTPPAWLRNELQAAMTDAAPVARRTQSCCPAADHRRVCVMVKANRAFPMTHKKCISHRFAPIARI